ncbi:Crp/Fnr family transcriptional regulator [Puniceibacterium sp. IMCC21224]|uniref:Crp/Fnr family transcriptional regulator n=1 Tax=Puniceibacterium sp. IMCC21224 TaxID=1618204 RepID=UPI00064D915D|nr:Crp/Fnr family transcriptional regulator [Puniceibacterium sp. IMCC21224]KMK66093.1 cAMP-binding protein [Puniceibacterium sp. IMCC21224]
MNNSRRFPQLLNCEILDGLSQAEKCAFLDVCILRTYKCPTEIMSQGETAQGMAIVARGTVEIAYLSEQGNRVVLRHIHVGDVFGEGETVAEMPLVASAVTGADTTLLFASLPRLREILQNPAFLRNFARNFILMMLRDNRLRSVDRFQPVEQRISSHLCQLSSGHPSIRASQADLASVVGCSRQTLNRVLGELRRHGIIDIRRKEILVLDPKALDLRAQNPY